jgi:N-acetylglucosaminyl-diphospho-decaprenol L-rhamnosyltransferase
MTMPLVTIIIVSYNTCDLLAQCLESLWTEIAAVAVSVVVVDNASHDGSVAMVRERFPWVAVVESPVNSGFAAANNLSLRDLASPYALLLNSDIVVTPGTIQHMLDCMERRPDAGVVGCRLLNADGSLQRSCWRFPHPLRALGEALGAAQALRRRSNYGEWDYASERRVDFVIGACLLLRKTALDQSGVFDERFFMYGEEMDLCYRLAHAGWSAWYTPACSIVHYGGASGTAGTAGQFLRAREMYFGKWYGRRGVAALRVSQAIGASLRIVAFSALATLRPQRASRDQLRRNAALLRWVIDPCGRDARDSARTSQDYRTPPYRDTHVV